MQSYPVPFNEKARLGALEALGDLGSNNDPVFDRVVALVRSIFDVPVALVSIVKEDQQWFKACDGLDLTGTPRSYAICAHTIQESRPLIIADAHADERFANHPVVVNRPHVRYYVGAPLILSSGFHIGSLCAIDFEAREAPSADKVRILEGLAWVVSAALERDAGAAGDLEESMRAQAESLASARQEFLSLISHELRTPLNGVLGLAGLLSEKVKDPAERELVDGILASGNQLLRIVSHVLTFSDCATGDLRLNEQPVETEKLLAGAVSTSLPAMRASGTSLRLGGDRPPARLLVDRAQFELALTCVISNASTHGGETVELSCRQDDGGDVVFTVRDDGAGIAANEVEKAMQPFGIGENVLTRRGHGIGLGLPLTKRLVELHGGELGFARKDGWTEVTLTLPASRANPRG